MTFDFTFKTFLGAVAFGAGFALGSGLVGIVFEFLARAANAK